VYQVNPVVVEIGTQHRGSVLDGVYLFAHGV
jgi:hypothetical protein